MPKGIVFSFLFFLILTTVKSVGGAIVVMLSSLQDPGCSTHQHVCYAQWWALL